MTGESILIVEDDGLIALRMQEVLTSYGYRVPDPLASGEEALQRMEESTPDLIVMDIGLLGNIDGLETARQIRNRYSIPVIFLTAYTDDMRIARARDISPYGYMVKPFRDDKLIGCIRSALLRETMDGSLDSTAH
jgi:two-component system, response regulator PdtaR